MKRLILLIITALAVVPMGLTAQISDNFLDGDFLQNPTWVGDDSLFIVNSQQQLQLYAPDAGIASLALPDIPPANLGEWRFRIRLAFAPSDNNFARVYLLANNSDLKAATCGYYLQFGEAGSGDVIELFALDNGVLRSICRGSVPISSSFTYNIKVTRDESLHWKIWVDELDIGVYSIDSEGDNIDVGCTLPDCAFGFYCKFTSGNKTKFYFDDVYVGPPIVDTIPPELISVETSNDATDQLLLTFSEPVSAATALDEQHYYLPQLNAWPSLCEFEGDDMRHIRLFFSQDFNQREVYRIHIEGIRDLEGNAMTPADRDFIFYDIRRNEILIHEIMAKPEPAVGLPPCEYIELYNSLPFPVSLQNWKLLLNNSEKVLPDTYLAAYGYAVIVPAAYMEQFDCENVISVSSLGITDDGQNITLLDGRGEVMHFVAFRKGWHENALKQKGGWSLEMIDPQNPCGGSENWGSSADMRGGTPGERNSISADNQDVVRPTMSKVVVSDSLNIRVFFSETVTADSLLLPSLFGIDRGVEVVWGRLQPPDFKIAELRLSEPLRTGIYYTLTLAGEACDCVGNTALQGSFLQFGLPSVPLPNDLVINEILSNPFEDSDGDFVEVYNRSDKIIDLGEVLIGSGSTDFPDNAVPVVAEGYQLFPRQYAAICKDAALTQSQYAPPDEAVLLKNEKLPSFANDAGTVHLISKGGDYIDRFAYDKAMHYALLTSTDGVSLERIRSDSPTQDAVNWTSAAEAYGWATPGYRNSQFAENAAGSDAVQVVPEVFSPDGDGFHDFAEIICNFEQSEYRLSVTIYNSDGLKIKQLANNQVACYEARFRWDGLTEDNRPALNGMYIVDVACWHTSGKTKHYRKVVSVVRKL